LVDLQSARIRIGNSKIPKFQAYQRRIVRQTMAQRMRNGKDPLPDGQMLLRLFRGQNANGRLTYAYEIETRS